MNTVEPIRDPRKIGSIKRMLRGHNLRDYALFTLGINTALRIGDILNLTLGDVLDQTGALREQLHLREQKTGREATVVLNDKARAALEEYLDTRNLTDFDAPLFPGQFKGGRYRDTPLNRRTVHAKITQWCADVGLANGPYGCHSLRKTWGYQARKQGVPLELIQAKLGHRSPSITRRYIGISQDEIAEIENRVEL